MTWRADGPQGNESAKIRHLIVPYTRGRVLDLGCGPFKAFPHFIGVDNLDHARRFGWPTDGVDVNSDCENLSLFADGSVDAVYSSHLLEHIEDYKSALKEWWRVIRPGGHLVLYLPHEKLYPNMGEPGANPDHKHDFALGGIIAAMEGITIRGKAAGWDLLENEVRAGGDEYSFFQVYRKREDGEITEATWRKPEKSLLLVRYGAFGDQIMASSVLPGLKAQGWHITYQTTPDGRQVVLNDPNIDAFWIQDKHQVPPGELSGYFDALRERYDKIVNLCESVEGSLLALKGRVNHGWNDDARRKLLNRNYLEHTHDIAGVPHDFAAKFHRTEAEQEQARKRHERYSGRKAAPVIAWSLAGSSVHKAWPWVDTTVAWLLERTDARVVLMGDDRERILEEAIVQGCCQYFGIPEERINRALEKYGATGLLRLLNKKLGAERLFASCGKWTIRESMAFACAADLVAGPETGILNAVCMEPMPKVVLLSHSTEENLTKHWVNTVSLTGEVPCYPCHRLHYDREYCPEHETGAAVCAAAIAPEMVFLAITAALFEAEGDRAA